jgi:tartrate dehydrogenase/decarboxylase/D-malate dehydrogenase
MMIRHRIALIPGDGIGAEVLPAARAVLDAVGNRHGINFTYDELDWSCRRYLDQGAMMPADGLDSIRHHDAILLGAVGWPGVPDHVSLWGLLIPIRRQFQQYVNLRPIRVLQGVPSPVANASGNDVDIVVVRENVEGEYSEIGGRINQGSPQELAVQQSVFTRAGTERILHYAFRTAAARRGPLVSATKSNGIVHTMPFWDQITREVSENYPSVTWRQEHIDALVAKIVLDPAHFDVIVGSNLFGDILSDLAAAVAGSIGMAPAGNLNPERDFPSMFEPVHGSAPDIAGRGIANPIGAIWSAAMMLDHLGHHDASVEIVDAFTTILATTEARTADLGGKATTREFTQVLLNHIATC